MIFTCKCLNIIIEGKNESEVEEFDSSRFGLSPEENPKIFFKEGCKQIEIKKIIKQVDSLVQGKTLKNKTIINRCLNCSLDCYYLCDDRKTAFINKALISDLETVNKLKNDKNFSPAFRIIISPLSEKKQGDKFSTHANSQGLESAVSSLQKQLGDIVQEQIAKTEDRIRTFSEQEYFHLKEFRDRAQRDHRCLLEAMYAAQRFFHEEETPAVARDDRIGSGGSPSIEIPVSRNETGAKIATVYKEKKPMQRHQRTREKNGSFDTEGLFPLEGMEDWPSDDLGRSEGESDTDHDDSGSHDEGIDVHRKKEDFGQLAKSLPVNVPVCTNAGVAELEGDDEPLDAVDIAASIKALARSLHGDAVFGDLPRPRFSTQI